jgi:hypothetical protein
MEKMKLNPLICFVRKSYDRGKEPRKSPSNGLVWIEFAQRAGHEKPIKLLIPKQKLSSHQVRLSISEISTSCVNQPGTTKPSGERITESAANTEITELNCGRIVRLPGNGKVARRGYRGRDRF